jgi:hypothetical protein
MASSTISLQDLARRIVSQESALAALRSRLETRLAHLSRRRDALRVELSIVETEIQAVTQGEGPPPVVPATAATPHRTMRPASSPSLAQFLVRLVRENKGKPVPMAQLKAETLHRRFPSTSADLSKMVEKRAYQLVQRGLLRRDPATGGFVLAGRTNGNQQPRAAGKRKVQAGSPATGKPDAAKTSAPAGAGMGEGQRPLRMVLLDVLRQAGRTLTAEELVAGARRAGYRSTSKNFKDVVWAAMGKLPEVERDPSGGYRLKKRKG